MSLRHGSLFSGIGGFDLAAEWCGWENVFHCEWNPFGQKVLKHYWPNSISYDDISKVDFRRHRGTIDILSGGFPCQPYSSAGKRLGKEDDRHLWPEMLRAIREISPTYVVGENVLGLTNWNGGLVFEEVQADLESEGYEVQPFILPAAGVNAPHKRDRVWFVARANRSNDGRTPGQDASEEGEKRIQERNQVRQPIKSGEVFENAPNTLRNGLHDKPAKENNKVREDNKQSGKQRIGTTKRFSDKWDAADPTYNGLEHRTESRGLSEGKGETRIGTRGFTKAKGEISDAANANSGRQPSKKHGQAETRRTTKASVSNDWENFPTQPPVRWGNDGLPSELDGITFPKWRNESIKAYGNAIVPQVAYQIFKVINEMEFS